MVVGACAHDVPVRQRHEPAGDRAAGGGLHGQGLHQLRHTGQFPAPVLWIRNYFFRIRIHFFR